MQTGITCTDSKLSLVESNADGYSLKDMTTFVEAHIGRGGKVYRDIHIESHDVPGQLTLPNIARMLTVIEEGRVNGEGYDVTILVPHLNILEYRQRNWAYLFFQTLHELRHINRLCLQLGSFQRNFQFPVFRVTFPELMNELFPDKVAPQTDTVPEPVPQQSSPSLQSPLLAQRTSTSLSPLPPERLSPMPTFEEPSGLRKRATSCQRVHQRSQSMGRTPSIPNTRVYREYEPPHAQPRGSQSRGPASDFFYNRFMPALDRAASKGKDFLTHTNPFLWCLSDNEQIELRRRKYK